MRRRIRHLIEKFIEAILLTSSTVTSITVLLIVFYLFKEAALVFKETPVEKNFSLLVSPQNQVRNLNSVQIKNIFDQEITNWKQVGGNDADIVLFRIDDLSSYYSEEELGENLEHVPEKIDELISTHPEMIGFVSDRFLPKKLATQRIIIAQNDLMEMLKGKEWMPTAAPAAQLGILPLILGTLMVSFGAILLALPFGIATAIYMSEIANPKIRNIFKPLIELLAGIPSVVYGFFGLVVLVPFIRTAFNLPVGETALAGSVILGIMALPTIITVSEDAIRNTPRAMKEASLALGANKWQTIIRVIIPYSISGITAAAILGIGRAVGETMAVLMVTGNSAIIPHTFLAPVRTIPATIAAELGEASFEGLHFKALFLLGCILFIITLITNFIVELVAPKRRVNG